MKRTVKSVLLIALKLDDAVTIDIPGKGRCRVVVTRIRRGEVRLGIEAPRDWPVGREQRRPADRPTQEVTR